MPPGLVLPDYESVAAAGNEMPVTGMVKSPQTFGHYRSL
jgi:hypothetical protein